MCLLISWVFISTLKNPLLGIIVKLLEVYVLSTRFLFMSLHNCLYELLVHNILVIEDCSFSWNHFIECHNGQ